MVKTKRPHQPFIFKVSKFSPNRLHIEIPSSRKKEFEAGEHVEIRKLSLTTKNRGEA